MRNLYAGQKATVGTRHEKNRLEKEYIKALYCHPTYLTCMQSTSCASAGLDEAQAGVKIAGLSISNLRRANDCTLMT